MGKSKSQPDAWDLSREEWRRDVLNGVYGPERAAAMRRDVLDGVHGPELAAAMRAGKGRRPGESGPDYQARRSAGNLAKDQMRRKTGQVDTGAQAYSLRCEADGGAVDVFSLSGLGLRGLMKDCDITISCGNKSALRVYSVILRGPRMAPVWALLNSYKIAERFDWNKGEGHTVVITLDPAIIKDGGEYSLTGRGAALIMPPSPDDATERAAMLTWATWIG